MFDCPEEIVPRIRLALLAAVAGSLALAPGASAELGFSEPHTTIAAPETGWEPYVEPIGDVDGDGTEDLLVQVEEGVSPCPAPARIVLGARAGASLDLAALGARGITITGLGSCLRDYGVAPLGDVNGDGRDDIGLTRPTPRVLFGRGGGTTIDAANPGTGGLTFSGGGEISVSRIGHVGDVNGDGRADIGLGGRYGSATDGLPVAGVVFGRPQGGTVDVGSPETPGLLIGDTTAARGSSPGIVRGVGDVNRDGKADVMVALPGYEQYAVVHGRPSNGFIDVSQPGAAFRLGSNPFSVELIRPHRFEDVDGDRGAELATEPGWLPVRIFRSASTPPYYDLGASAPRTEIAASLGLVASHTWVGDVAGDGARDAMFTAFYLWRTGRWMEAFGGIRLSYVVSDLRPRSVDLRLTTVGVHRLGLPDGYATVLAAARFRGRAARQVVTQVGDGLAVQEIVERPDPPADTEPPVLGDVGFDAAEIFRDCDTESWAECPRPAASALRFTASEPTYVDMTIRRGSAFVTSVRGTVVGGSFLGQQAPPTEWTFSAIERSGWGAVADRLPAGTYTATLRPTDLAGNTGETRTATIEVR